MRVFNFSAGPATLPEPVLLRMREDLPDWAGTGMAVMEISHRSREFVALAERSEAAVRGLLSIPDHYSVLFMQGGATAQFSAVPLNLAACGDHADYVVTGAWGQKAVKLGAPLIDARLAADGSDSGYQRIPKRANWTLSSDAAYVHYTPNETIGGVEYPEIPDVGDRPLVADMSSSILSRPLDVERFGLIYAGAQKNIGPAGLTLVIVRDDLLGKARPETPSVLNYQTAANAGSMFNTPPTYTWYVAGLVFEWLQEQGGLGAVEAANRAKKDRLYAAIDTSDFYSNPVYPAHRSWMNVPFLLAEPGRDEAFLAGSVAAGLANLKGHRSVGGMRASLYNAMPMAGVDALIEYMREFERRA